MSSIDELSFELSSRRTGLSFQRTRMSADRTLMSIIRTALSLIGFGFTIYQFFHYLRDTAGATQVVPVQAPSRFGLALVLLGSGMLFVGILNHVAFMREIRAERKLLLEEKLVHGKLSFPVSSTFVVALLLLLLGLVSVFGMLLRIGPLH